MPTGLVCPATVGVGEEIVVSVTHVPDSCCSADGARAVAVPRGDSAFLVSTLWDACSCCDVCDCVGAPVTQRVSLGVADRAGVVVASAGPHECEIAIVERSCEPLTIDEAHAPIGVAIGEPIPVLVRRHEGSGCGCVPRGARWIGREGPLVAGLEACDCSSEDPCVDPGYEATSIALEAAGEGPTSIETQGAAPLVVQGFDPAACYGAPSVVGLAIEAPSESLIGSGELGVWARIDLEAYYCCAGPASLVRTNAVTSPFSIALDVLDCNQADCACVPTAPTRWSHWHWLGALAPGEYDLRVGGRAVMFAVR